MDTMKYKFDDQVNMSIIKEAAKILQSGGIVAFPTETVYGLGADALQPDAVKKIFAAKGRPQDNPLIIHVADKDISEYVTDVPEMAKKLMEKFWPGPLTIIFRKNEIIPEETSAGLDTVGVRMPSDEVARLLIKELKHPIAAPSANISGKPSPTNFERCVEDLDGKVDMIIGYGDSVVGLESTIVDYSVDPPRLLRPGFVTYEELLEVDPQILYDEAKTKAGEKEIPKAPGMKYRHYAPKAPLFVILGQKDKVKSKIISLIELNKIEHKSIGVLAPAERKSDYEGEEVHFISLGSEADSYEMARNLFEGLRKFDDLKVDIILSEGFPEEGIGSAIMNRLKKASGYHIIEV